MYSLSSILIKFSYLLIGVVFAILCAQWGTEAARFAVKDKVANLSGYRAGTNSYMLAPSLSRIGFIEQGFRDSVHEPFNRWRVRVRGSDGRSLSYWAEDKSSDSIPDEITLVFSRGSKLQDTLIVADEDLDGHFDVLEVTLSRNASGESFSTYVDYDISGNWDACFHYDHGRISKVEICKDDHWIEVEMVNPEKDFTFRDKRAPNILYQYIDKQWVQDSIP